MKIIAHRGLWAKKKERNTLKAFKKSFSHRFGVETDVRDYLGELVISHDIPDDRCIKLDTLFETYNSFLNKNNIPLALNIKADGLQKLLLEKLLKYDIDNYFVFDMTIPDTIGYLKNEITFFMRQSEIENELPFYENARGVWIDCFYSDWIHEKIIENHLQKNKMVCLVSPELHKRNYQEYWSKLKEMDLISNDKVIICTDFPDKASFFFNE